MPSDSRAREVATEWLRRARSHLIRAKQPKPPEVFWEDLCFDAQQAAEKATKAVLVCHQIDFPRTHRLAELLGLLQQAGHAAPEDVWQADRLSDYAEEIRYPGHSYPVDEAEYRQAIELADEVFRWAGRIVSVV
jgi:HEPN domain-containing protein